MRAAALIVFLGVMALGNVYWIVEWGLHLYGDEHVMFFAGVNFLVYLVLLVLVVRRTINAAVDARVKRGQP